VSDCKIFFCFDNNEFAEKCKKLGEKVISIGAGGFLPVSQKDKFSKQIEEIEKWSKKEMAIMKQEKKEKRNAINYELINHECYHTCDIEPVVELFIGVFTQTEIQKVYNLNVNK